MKKRRVWWQSSTTLKSLPDYKEAILRHGARVLGDAYEVDPHGVDLGSWDIHFMGIQFLNDRSLLGNILKASDLGYDAIAFGCLCDPVLFESRELVDIPVLGLGETAMLFSCLLGRRFSIVTYNSQIAVKRYENLIRLYGLESRAAPIVAFEINLEDLGKSFEHSKPVIDAFLDACKKAVDKGAEVIIPGCGILNLVMVENGINTVPDSGATILDITGALMKTVDSMIVLKEQSGMKPSGAGLFARPSDSQIRLARQIYSI